MSQNPYDAPQSDSAAESGPRAPVRQDRSPLDAHASAFGHGLMAYLAFVGWIGVAMRLHALPLRPTSSDVEAWILLQWLTPILPGLLVWVIVLRDGLAERKSHAVRWLFWTTLVAMAAALMVSGLLMDD